MEILPKIVCQLIIDSCHVCQHFDKAGDSVTSVCGPDCEVCYLSRVMSELEIPETDDAVFTEDEDDYYEGTLLWTEDIVNCYRFI